jgi:hypothetical protein
MTKGNVNRLIQQRDDALKQLEALRSQSDRLPSEKPRLVREETNSLDSESDSDSDDMVITSTRKGKRARQSKAQPAKPDDERIEALFKKLELLESKIGKHEPKTRSHSELPVNIYMNQSDPLPIPPKNKLARSTSSFLQF